MGTRGQGGGFARGRGRGRDGHALRCNAGRTEAPAVKNSCDSNGDGGGNVIKHEGKSHARSDQTPASHRSNRVVTTVMENGTEVPKKLNNKVFIDGLPYENQIELGSSLEEELMQFATTWKVGRPIRLIKRDGQGFGFLVFHSPHSVDVAVRVLNGRKFLGRTLRVEVPKPKDMTSAEESSRDIGKSNYSRQVLLSDLAKVAHPEIIREILRDVAPQLEKRLESIKMTSSNRKAFLTFLAPEDVGSAVQFFNGFSMLGRRIAAAPAAAPGSLPYSKSSFGNTAVAHHSAKGDASNNGNADHVNVSEDIPVLPLGVDAPAALKTQRHADRKPAAKEGGLSSNVTGVTEKYNLLDTGSAEVFVGNLGDEITEEQLYRHFEVCGKIKLCEIIVNKVTQLSTGIARIVFALPAYASYAQRHLHGSRLHGHVLHVDRGGERSAPLLSELTPQDGEDEEIDEDGYMKHYGVTDKEAYFKGTSLEQGGRGSKRARSDAADGKGRNKSKMARVDQPGLSAGGRDKGSTDVSGGGKTNKNNKKDADDDEEEEGEHFYDVDEVDVPVTAPGNQKSRKRRLVTPKQAVKRGAKAKKSVV